MALVSLISFKIKNKIKKIINIIIFSCIFSFYFFEFYISYEQFNFNKKSKLSFLNDYKKTINEDVVTVIPPKEHLNANYNFFPLGGISNIETIYCNELGFYTVYKSDKYGFNNNASVWDNKEIDYVLIGDSFVHGACVENKFNIANRISEYSNRSVLNLGMAGNSFLIYYATLKEYININKTKRVLIFFTEDNDLEGLKFEAKDKKLKKYLNNNNYTQNLKKNQGEIDKILFNVFKISLEKEITDAKKRKYNQLNNFLKLYNLRSLTFDKINKPKISQPNTYELFEDILKKIKNYFKNTDVDFYFVYLPSYSRITKKEYNNIKYEKVLNLLKKNEIKFIDIYQDLLQGHPNPVSLFALEGRGHFNRKGYGLIGEIVYKKILEFEK